MSETVEQTPQKKKYNYTRKPGRPPMYSTPEEMEEKIEEYFNGGAEKKIVETKSGEVIEIPIYTITGLCLYLGFCDRHSFYAYEADKKEFSNTMKRARARIEIEYEKALMSGYSSGAIFALKNFGWSDKQEVVQQNTNINANVETTPDTLAKVVQQAKELLK